MITLLYFARVAFYYIILTPLTKFTRFGHSTKRKLRKLLFYSEISLILVEGFLDFSIAFFTYTQYDPSIEFNISLFVSLCSFILVFMILPSILINIIAQD